MQRWSSVALGLVFAAGLVALALWSRPRLPAEAAPTVSAEVVVAAEAPTTAPDAPPPDGPASEDDSADLELQLAPDTTDEVSALPPSAAKSVEFGVILVTYAGAQQAPTGARSKPEALVLAKTLLEEARTDFKAAVKRGDRGSVATAGRLPRGVLEPRLEYALFTLQKGDLVSEPLDTPRGYWIAKRLD